MRFHSHLGFLYLTIIFISNIPTTYSDPSQSSFGEKNNSTSSSSSSSSSHRKLLTHRKCTSKEISISQSKDTTSGIPQYMVQIANTCVFGSSCLPSNIHLHCASFASERIVNPLTFKRLSFDDCLVNAGRPLKTSQVIKFTYSNSFMYPLSLRSVNFC